MSATRAFCPVHEPVRGECGAQCLDARLAFARAAHALVAYWRDHKAPALRQLKARAAA